MTDDAALIRRYLDGSDEAFAELVRCHIGTVYGTALRVLAGDTHLANDVTQKVFTDLARKALSLADRPAIVGWLYQSTQYAAAKAVRSEQRWRNREQKAQAMNEIENEGAPEPDWSALRPVIDSAMNDLKEGDRDALLLRFFQARTFSEIGDALGLNENAARMRVDRALDKLRDLLARRGIKSTAAALGAVMAGQLATAAPATLAATVATTALAGAGAATGATLFFMGMTKIQTGIAAALVVAGGSVLWSEGQTGARLRAENSALAKQIAATAGSEAERSSGQNADAQKASLYRKQIAELDELRKEEEHLKRALAERAKEEDALITKVQKLPDGQTFYNLKQLDIQPKPKKRVPPVYPLELKKMGLSGEVLVEFVLKPDGTIGNISVLKSSNDALAAAAIEAMAKWEFVPGQKSGRPVYARMQQPFVFSISEEGVTDWF